MLATLYCQVKLGKWLNKMNACIKTMLQEQYYSEGMLTAKH